MAGQNIGLLEEGSENIDLLLDILLGFKNPNQKRRKESMAHNKTTDLKLFGYQID